MMQRFMHDERGAAMLIALSLLFMMALMGVSAIQTSSVDMNITDNYKQDARSFYIAEAGLEHACSVLRDSAGWRTGLSEVTFGGGSYSVRVLDADSVADLADSIMIIAIGRRSDAVSTVSVKLTAGRMFRWAAFGDDRFDLNGNTETDSYDSDSGSYASTHRDEAGDVGSNGIVGINGNATINGDASTSSPGDMTIGGSSIVTGDTTTTAPVVNLPPVTAAEIANAKANSAAPAGLSGTYTYNSGSRSLSVKPGKTLTLADGTYYFSTMDVKGAIAVQSGATVKIYMDGDFQANATAAINTAGQPAQLQFFLRGAKFTVNGSAEIRSVVYAPESQMELNGGGNFYGAFIARDIQENGGSHFHYDRALRNFSFGDMTRVAWKEL